MAMDVNEALRSEIESLKNVIESISAERHAIDQVALSQIKEVVNVRTQLNILNNMLQKKNAECEELKKKIESLVISPCEPQLDAA
jgi:predicted RNase H-like nuclease (RuvC/YqgF family)